MRTVSLRRRVVRAGAVIVAIVLAGVNCFVWLNVRDHLVDNLRTTLDNRAALAEAFAPTIDPTELARLAGSEVIVSIRGEDGTEIIHGTDPATSALRPATWPGLSRRVHLPSGDAVVLTASRTSVDRTLRRVAMSEAIGTFLGLGVAVLLLRRGARVALRPIDSVVATARQIRSGHTGDRLKPDRIDTELGRMALAFDEMLDRLEAALAEARASEEAEKRFLAEAAHQLRSPIAGIQASVEALPAARDPGERDRLLAHVARESGRAGRRVAGLLTMARLDRQAEPARRRVNVVALCREEVERTAILAAALRVDFSADRAWMMATVDADAIREALSNLLDNARRHARSSMSVRVVTTGTDVELRVSDDGPGVPDEDTEQVFERFVSLDGQGGSGLGLAIVRWVARNHGGEAAYEGGAFAVRIPIMAPP